MKVYLATGESQRPLSMVARKLGMLSHLAANLSAMFEGHVPELPSAEFGLVVTGRNSQVH